MHVRAARNAADPHRPTAPCALTARRAGSDGHALRVARARTRLQPREKARTRTDGRAQAGSAQEAARAPPGVGAIAHAHALARTVAPDAAPDARAVGVRVARTAQPRGREGPTRAVCNFADGCRSPAVVARPALHASARERIAKRRRALAHGRAARSRIDTPVCARVPRTRVGGRQRGRGARSLGGAPLADRAVLVRLASREAPSAQAQLTFRTAARGVTPCGVRSAVHVAAARCSARHACVPRRIAEHRELLATADGQHHDERRPTRAHAPQGISDAASRPHFARPCRRSPASGRDRPRARRPPRDYRRPSP